uniref:Secreted peptide n=1 Tax=Anopheles braziliensis TaxID=58242 RepID=A0A2M3ZLV3_9DIPT
MVMRLLLLMVLLLLLLLLMMQRSRFVQIDCGHIAARWSTACCRRSMHHRRYCRVQHRGRRRSNRMVMVLMLMMLMLTYLAIGCHHHGRGQVLHV